MAPIRWKIMGSPRILPLLALPLVLAAGTPFARAQEPPTVSPGDVDSRDVQTKARSLYELGMRHYNLNEHDQAIAAFKEGYKLTGSPGFLFNIAQSYRLKGDCAQALTFYRNYLRADPAAENRAAVEEKIAAMETCVRKARAAEEEKAAASQSRTPPAKPSRAPRILGLVLVGAGLAAAGASVYFGLDARKASRAVDDLYLAGGSWDEAAQEEERRGRRSQALMISLSVSGAALALGGAALAWLGWRQRAERTKGSLALVPLPGGGTLAWRIDL